MKREASPLAFAVGRWPLAFASLLSAFCPLATAAPALSTPTIYPTEGFNLKINAVNETATETQIEVEPAVKKAAHNWFAATFTGLPVGRAVTIAVAMKGHDTTNRADVTKWRGLRPVLSYADPTLPASYLSYTQNAQGRWYSDDPFLSPAARFAGNGPLPRQNAIPAALAAQFLSTQRRPAPQNKKSRNKKDKTPPPPPVQTWSAWREIETVEADVKNNVFRIHHTFDNPAAVVAMRVPYTTTFLDAFMTRLKTARRRGVILQPAGESAGGRKLYVVGVEDPLASEEEIESRPTILVIAREHATEHASSWAVHGLLLALLGETPVGAELRRSANWLLIPMQDPDGVADSHFERMTERFRDPNDPTTPPEVFAYARYLRDYLDSGRSVSLAVSIHNVESDEAANLSTPFTDNRYVEATHRFNSVLFPFLEKAGGFEVGGAQSGQVGASPWRFYGWSASQFGALPLAYEVNDRYPKKRLSHAQLQRLGVGLGLGLASWCRSAVGIQWQRGVEAGLAARQKSRKEYLAEQGEAQDESRRRYDLLMKGF